MKFLRSLVESAALLAICFAAFAVVYFVLPLLNRYDEGGPIMMLLNLCMANVVFYGIPYWHLTDLKRDGFLPAANSYLLIWILAILSVSVLASAFNGADSWYILYLICQSGLALFVLFKAIKHHRSTAA